jgi:hypothetical protein
MLQIGGALDVGRQIVAVALGQIGLGLHTDGQPQEAQRFAAQHVEQQPGGDLAVLGILLDHGAGGHHQRLTDVGLAHAVEEVAQRVGQDRLRIHGVEIATGLVEQAGQACDIQRAGAAVGERHGERVRGLGRRACRRALGTLAGAGLAVEDVVARDLVLAGPHQGQLDLILDVLDMDGAAAGQPPREGRGDLLGELAHPVVDATGGRRRAAFHGEERLGHGDHDLVGVEMGDLAVAPDDLDLARGVGGDLGSRVAVPDLARARRVCPGRATASSADVDSTNDGLSVDMAPPGMACDGGAV